jgi:predicted ATPase
MIFQSQQMPDGHCVPWVHLTNMPYIVVTNITAEKHVTPFDGDVYLDQMLPNVFYFFKTSNFNM